MAGVTQVPQEHCVPDHEKLPTRAEHFGQCTLPSPSEIQEGQASKNKRAHASGPAQLLLLLLILSLWTPGKPAADDVAKVSAVVEVVAETDVCLEVDACFRFFHENSCFWGS